MPEELICNISVFIDDSHKDYTVELNTESKDGRLKCYHHVVFSKVSDAFGCADVLSELYGKLGAKIDRVIEVC